MKAIVYIAIVYKAIAQLYISFADVKNTAMKDSTRLSRC